MSEAANLRAELGAAWLDRDTSFGKEGQFPRNGPPPRASLVTGPYASSASSPFASASSELIFSLSSFDLFPAPASLATSFNGLEADALKNEAELRSALVRPLQKTKQPTDPR